MSPSSSVPAGPGRSTTTRAVAAGLALCLATLASPAAGHAAVHAFRGATIHPVSAPPIDDGVLLVDGGEIVAVGPAASIEIPAGATVHDVGGQVIVPGLVDTHSHVGGPSGGDRSAALNSAVRAMDSIDIRSPHFVKALSGGITTVNVMPGSGHLMSGQTAYLKIRRAGDDVVDWMFCDDPLTEICGGMKMANGTNSIRQSPFPGTRAKAAAMVRELFIEARSYREKQETASAAEGEAGEVPSRDLGMEALVEVLDGRRTVHFHTHRADDILTALRLAREFGFTPVLQHVSEAWKVADEIARAGAVASLTLVDAPGGKEEALGLSWKSAAALAAAGVPVAINTDDWIVDSRFLFRAAAFAVRAGLSPEAALDSLTLTPARMLDVGDRVGSLEPGKDADFVLLSGDPFSVTTRVLETWVEGEKVFDLDDPADRLVAEGGYGAFDGAGHAIHVHDGGVH